MNYTPLQFAAFKLQEETGLTAEQILKLDSDEYARLTQRPTVGEIAAQAHTYTSPAPQQAPAPQNAPQEPAEPDPLSMSWQEYARWREQSGLAGRSAEGMSRASLSMAGRFERDHVPANGRRTFYSGQ